MNENFLVYIYLTVICMSYILRVKCIFVYEILRNKFYYTFIRPPEECMLAGRRPEVI